MDYHFFLTSKHYAALIMNKDIIGRLKPSMKSYSYLKKNFIISPSKS